MAGTRTLNYTDATGQTKSLNLLDEDAWREIFPELYDGRNRNPSLITLYREQGFLRRCVDVRASALSDIPWNVYPEGADEPIWGPDMETPDNLGPISDLQHVLFEIEASLTLLGRAYRLKEVRQGQEMGLRILPAQQMEPDKGRYSSDVKHYKRTVNGETEKHRPEDVVAVHYPDAFTDRPPTGPGRSAKNDAEVLHALSRFLDSFLDRGLIKATILTVDGGAPEEERNRLEQWWNRWFSGASSAGQQKVVNAAVEPKTVGDGLSELEGTEIVQQARQAISTALGVPHSVVMSDAANFATANADRLNFYQQTVIPDSRLIESALNRQYFRERGLRFEFNPSQVEALQAYELEKAEAISKVVGRPVLTVDEGRELLGYEPMDGQAGGDQVPEAAVSEPSKGAPQPDVDFR